MSKRQSRPSLRWWHIPAAIATSLAIWLIIVFTVALVHAFNHRGHPTQWGVSFSIKQAQFLGLDWQQTYTALLDDMPLKHFRLMSHWDIGEPQPGIYQFEDLDWQFAEAHRRGAKVTLAIGLRQPRWPECHMPIWTQQLQRKQQLSALNTYLKTVVARYRDHPALESYQLENEALLHTFGNCPQRSRDELDTELRLVKQLDNNTPVYMSISDQYGLPLNKPRPDGYGFSLYRRNWSPPINAYFHYPFLPSWYGGRAQIISWYTGGKPVFIHELQLEPWGPAPIPQLTIAQQNESMSRQQVVNTFNFARQTHIPRVYTWGGEWWYWRKTVMNDVSIWNTIKDELTKR